MAREEFPRPEPKRKHIGAYISPEKTESELPSVETPALARRIAHMRAEDAAELTRPAISRKKVESYSAPRNINYEIVNNWIDRAESVIALRELIQDLYDKPLGDSSDEAHHPGYPWEESPDEILGAINTYIASKCTDRAALSRIPQECRLREKVEELLPPQTIH